MKRKKGVITIFLCLCLMLLISFLCTALQSARLAGSRFLFSQAASALVTSMYGGYDRLLWKKYHVMAVTDEGKMEEIRQRGTESYEEKSGLFWVDLDSWEEISCQTLLSQGGLGFQKAAVSYMECELPGEAVRLLFHQLGILPDFKTLADWFENCKNLIRPILQIEMKWKEWELRYQDTLAVLETCKAEASALMEVVGRIREWRDSWKGETEKAEEGANRRRSQEKDQGEPSQADRTQENILVLLEDFTKYGEDFQRLVGQKDSLLSMAASLPQMLEEAKALTDQIRQLFSLEKELGGERETVSGQFGQYAGDLLSRLNGLSGILGQIEGVLKWIDRLEALQIPTLDDMALEDGMQILESWEQVLREIGILSLEKLTEEILPETEEERKKLGDFWHLKEWLSEGFLEVLLPGAGGLSDKEMSLANLLPRTEGEEQSLLEDGYSSLLLGEYILHHCGHFGKEDSYGMRYETEYILWGNLGDKENLAATALAMMGIRSALNFLFLLQNTEFRQQVTGVARGISLALGGMLPVAVGVILLLVLWAIGEAFLDVRSLLQNQTVPLWKTRQTWTLSWGNLWTLFEEDTRDGLRGMTGEGGMDYEAYLRVLLFARSLSQKTFRTMEIMQENLQQWNPSFWISRAKIGGEWEIKGRAAGRSCQVRRVFSYE